MAASLADQLLRQHGFDIQQLSRDISLADLHAGGVDMMKTLVNWLVRHLPRPVNLVFIVDGVVLYERDQFEAGLSVLKGLAYLARDPSVPATVKVLFTTTSSPRVLKQEFEDEHEHMIIDVARLQPMPWAPNDDRVANKLTGMKPIYFMRVRQQGGQAEGRQVGCDDRGPDILYGRNRSHGRTLGLHKAVQPDTTASTTTHSVYNVFIMQCVNGLV
jgi:hypothetical protein